MKRARSAATVLMLALVGASARAGEGVALRLRLEPGKTYAQWILVDQRITQEIDGQAQTIEQRLGLGLSLRVLEVAGDGGMRAHVTLTRLLVEERGASEAFTYDSAKKRKKGEKLPPYAETYAALAGAAFTVRLSPLGRVRSAEGLDALGRGVVRSAPGAGAARRLAQLAGTRLAPEALEGRLALLLDHLPEEPVAPGGTWTRRVEGSGGLPLAVETTYTLRSRADGKATLDLALRTSPLPDAGALDLKIAAVRPQLEGTGTGRMVVDERTGWVESARMETVCTGEIRAGISEDERAQWPVTIRCTVTMGPMPEESGE